MNRSSMLVWSLALVVAGAVLALIPAVIIAQGNERTTLTTANGKAVESIRTVTETAFTSFGESGGFVPVPSMTLPVPDAVANSDDLVVIEFSASCLVTGDRVGDDDGILLEVRVDGIPVAPTGGTQAFTFSTSQTFMSSSHQFAMRVPAGAHTVQVLCDLNDDRFDETLIGVIGDATLTVTRAN